MGFPMDHNDDIYGVLTLAKRFRPENLFTMLFFILINGGSAFKNTPKSCTLE